MEPLSAEDGRILLAVARERIASAIEQRDPVYPVPTPALHRRGGAFVTLRIEDGDRASLRGCIGRIEAHDELVETVRSVAYSSAFQDYRFQPLTAAEYPRVSVEISVLSPLEEITDPSLVQPGTHGLYLKSTHRSGLLLPQVATEYGWNREEFLAHTCRKAGLPPTAWRASCTALYIFTAQIFEEND